MAKARGLRRSTRKVSRQYRLNVQELEPATTASGPPLRARERIHGVRYLSAPERIVDFGNDEPELATMSQRARASAREFRAARWRPAL